MVRVRKIFLVKPDSPSGPPPQQGEGNRNSDPHARIVDMPELRRMPAGSLAPVSGVYRVYHKDHRLPHSLYFHVERLLPACRVCGNDVEYGLLLAAPLPDSDLDFAKPPKTGTY